MKEVFNILESLTRTNSNKEKIAILESHKDNQKLKDFLYRCYNPYIVYNIQKVPVLIQNLTITRSPDENWVIMTNLLEQLNTRTLSGNAARDALAQFLSTCSINEQIWFSKLIQKDLKVGITEVTINKVWVDLIPTFCVQLAEDLKGEFAESKYYPKLNPTESLIEPKLDGMRIIAIKRDSDVALHSRNGRLIFGYDDLAGELKTLMPNNTVLDGELMSTSFEVKLRNLMELYATGKYDDARLLLEDDTVFGQLMTSAFAKGVNKKGVYNVFDMLTLEEFEEQTSERSTTERKSALNMLLEGASLNSVKSVPSILVQTSDTAKVLEFYETCLNYGYEGIMIKDPNSPYLFKRGWNVAKLKPFITVDLTVDRLYEGKQGTKYEGMMGGAVVIYKGEEVNVGGGWDENQRAYFWNNPHELIGLTIEVTAQGESKDKTGKPSLRFPRFKCVRQDK